MASDNSQPTALLTLGRLPAAVELARAFHKAGWRVIVAEPFTWHLCRLSNTVAKSFKVTAPANNSDAYLAELLDIVGKENVSLVVPVSEEIMFVAALKARLSATVTVMCTEQSVLLSLHDKFAFNQMAVRLQLAVPHTELASEAEALEPLIAKGYVVKPRFSCAGAGVTINAAGAQFHAPQKADAYIVQARLAGPQCCTFSIAFEGRALVTICYRSLIDNGFVAVRFEQMPLPDTVNDFINRVVAQTHFSGMISFDFMCDEHGNWQAIECNPRATSGLHFLCPEVILHSLLDAQTPTTQDYTGRRQEFWSCLLELEAALLKGKFDRQSWAQLFSTRDITWQRLDIKPFLFMSFITAPDLLRALFRGQPLSQLLMKDVSWHDG